MPSTSPSRLLVTRTFATDKYCPTFGEVMVVPLPQPLFGPGSTLGSTLGSVRGLATRRDYHHVVVVWAGVSFCEGVIDLIVLPMPDYSAIDPISGLSSTEWLLSQPADYQQLHIPVPYEQMPSVTSPKPPFPTPKQFGNPIELDGWKDTVPRWIQAVPMFTEVTLTEKFMSYEPPVNLSRDDLRRLKAYGGLPCWPNLPYPMPCPNPFDTGGGNAFNDVPPLVPDSDGDSPSPREHSSYCGAALGVGRSSVLRKLYATDAVKAGFAELLNHQRAPLIIDSVLRDDSDDSDDDYGDDDYDDDDEDKEDLGPFTIARWKGAGNSHMVKLVQDYEDRMRERMIQL